MERIHRSSHPLPTDRSRRRFLRGSITFSVVSMVAPGVMIGKLSPRSVRRRADGTLAATLTIAIAEYPELMKQWGSVKLQEHSALLVMNPDHCLRGDIMKPAERGRFPIAVTRVAASGPDAFRAVSTLCAHSIGFQLNYRQNGADSLFVCPHLNSTFRPDGTWVPPKTSPYADDSSPQDVGNLRSFPTAFDETNGLLTISDISVGNCSAPTVMPQPEEPLLGLVAVCRSGAMQIVRLQLPTDAHVQLSVERPDGSRAALILAADKPRGIHHITVPVAGYHDNGHSLVLKTPSGEQRLLL